MSFQALDQIEAFLAREARVFVLHPVGWTPGILAAGAVAYWRLLLRLALPPCLVVPTSTSSGPSHPTHVTLTPLPLSSRHVGGVTLGI